MTTPTYKQHKGGHCSEDSQPPRSIARPSDIKHTQPQKTWTEYCTFKFNCSRIQLVHHGGTREGAQDRVSIFDLSLTQLVRSNISCRPIVDEHKETTERKASIFDDEQKRRESLARLTANIEGE